MLLDYTLRRFPLTGASKNECGLPFACVVQPFAEPLEATRGPSPPCSVTLEEIARCSECYAYVNKHCDFQPDGWICALCGRFNEVGSLKAARYARSLGRRQLPELQADFVEIQCAFEDAADGSEEGSGPTYEKPALPACIALVDSSCNEDVLELVRSALLAALEALQPGALFGLATFSDKIGLVEVQGRVQSVKYVPLNSGSAGSPTPLDLGDAVPMDAFLAPAEACKQNISAAIDNLRTAHSSGAATSLEVSGQEGSSRRGFGAAFQVVANMLNSRQRTITIRLSLADTASLQHRVAIEHMRHPAVCSAFPAALYITHAGKNDEMRKGIVTNPSAMLRYLGSARQHFGHPANGVSQAKEGPGPVWSADTANGLDITGTQILAFLSGPPNYGRGATSSSSRTRQDSRPQKQQALHSDLEAGDMFEDIALLQNHTDRESQHPAPPPENGTEQMQSPPEGSARTFYEDAAVAASSLGVSVEVFALSPRSCGLEYIEPLASSSGGSLHLYTSIEDAALPQDAYRRVSGPQASAGLLRIRTSPEFRVARAFGQLFPDERYENLAHIVACGPGTAVAFDFEFCNTEGFSDAPDNPPMLQIAFQYDIVVPSRAATGQLTNEQEQPRDSRPRYTLQRRLRVLTTPAKVARSCTEVYQHVNADAVLAILVHKIGRAASSEGLREARTLLQDWLVLFSARFNTNLMRQEQRGLPNSADEVDVRFNAFETAKPLPRLAYALLRSPLLTLEEPEHPDLRAVANHLWASLPPDLLRCAIYPMLTSYSDPDTQACAQHALSRAALISAGAPIFLLDSFSELFVYYVVGCPPHLPFPPPAQSRLRRTINALRQRRRPTPSLRMLRGGIDDIQPFLACLVEEAELDASARVVTPGFEEFLAQIGSEAWSYLTKSVV